MCCCSAVVPFGVRNGRHLCVCVCVCVFVCVMIGVMIGLQWTRPSATHLVAHPLVVRVHVDVGRGDCEDESAEEKCRDLYRDIQYAKTCVHTISFSHCATCTHKIPSKPLTHLNQQASNHHQVHIVLTNSSGIPCSLTRACPRQAQALSRVPPTCPRAARSP